MANYEQSNERMAINELYARWMEFMKYANKKAKTIPDIMLREYCNFVSNVALRFGAMNAIYSSPEIPNEALGQYIREYEKDLVEWSGYLAEIERREARFRSGMAKKAEEAKCGCATAEVPVPPEKEENCCSRNEVAPPEYAEWLAGGAPEPDDKESGAKPKKP